jgi:hypothetical protein
MDVTVRFDSTLILDHLDYSSGFGRRERKAKRRMTGTQEKADIVRNDHEGESK